MRLDKSKVAGLVRTDYGSQMLAEGDRAQAGNPEKEQVWMLLVSEIDPDLEQPRHYFDEAKLQDLADDIARRGVLQPILVRQEGQRYRIVVGERRWRASKLAGKPRIPCLIRELDETGIREAQMVENVIREGVSDVERGVALRRLYEDRKRRDRDTTWEDVARIVGIGRMRINHLVNLALLPDNIVQMIHAREISGSHGTELARLRDFPEPQQQLAAASKRLPGDRTVYGLSVATLRDRVNAILTTGSPKPSARPSAPSDAWTLWQQQTASVLAGVATLSSEQRARLQQTAEDILRALEPPDNS